MSIIALIPARGGSQRIPGKNVKDFCGQPLMAWAIEAAQRSGIFSQIIVSSDDDTALGIAKDRGVSPLKCGLDIAHNHDDPDIKWVRHALSELSDFHDFDAFAILRPTSPFRRAETIRRAWEQFGHGGERFNSLRAVELCKQHPCKMWELWDWTGNDNVRRHVSIRPFVEDFGDWRGRRVPAEVNGVPAHSCPYQVLPRVFVQNASLEIAWGSTVREMGTIAGEYVMPFFTEGYEGLDLNTPEDWILAEELVKRGLVTP